MDKNTIYNALLKYKQRGMSSFHTPGHKNNFFEDFFNSLDYTELDDTDDLYNPKSTILETEKKASKLFGSGYTLISAGGCTLCIQAMLSVFCEKKSKILCSRIIHRSAINTMAILDLEPVFLLPKINIKTGIYEQTTSVEVETFLKKDKNIKTVYITSPDYYGNIADIKNISAVCKKYKVPLLVDNAHGSHLAFLNKNIHPLYLGADATTDSLHKTLPVLTGGALLHLKNQDLYKKAKYFMEFFGSSSPSFPIMASIDLCLNWLKKCGKTEFLKLTNEVNYVKKLAVDCNLTSLEFYNEYINQINNSYKNINTDGHYESLENKNKLKNSKKSSFFKNNFDFGTNCSANSNFCPLDPTRICFNTKSIGLTGKEIVKIFRENKVEPEFYDENFIVLIPSPFNTRHDFYNLEKAIRSLPKRKIRCFENTNFDFSLPKVSCTLHEAVFEKKSTYVSTENAIGLIAAKAENVCPPGIPIVIPGEKINEKTVEILKKNEIKEVEVLK